MKKWACAIALSLTQASWLFAQNPGPADPAVDSRTLFCAMNYFLAAAVYLVLLVLSFGVYLAYRRKNKKRWSWYFLGLSIEAFCIVLHTCYWGYAKLVESFGMHDLYAKLSAPIPFAMAQGFETVGGVVMVATFIVVFYYAPKEGQG